MEADVRNGNRRGGPAARPQPKAPQGRSEFTKVTISRPTQIPQWPLRGPVPLPAGPSASGPGTEEPPATQSRAPQRPPRPSRVPSILDSSRVQDPIPVFKHQTQDATIPEAGDTSQSVPPTPTSSTVSIPDFPMPLAAGDPAMPPLRRSVTLGPPPSSRRGASSYYSTVSLVSPIPEESPRTRSYTSFASSAAMPEGWRTRSPGNSPGYSDGPYDDRTSTYAEDQSYVSAGVSGIARSASMGKKGVPQIVMNRGAASRAEVLRGPALAKQKADPLGDATEPGPESSSNATADVASTRSDPSRTATVPSNPALSRSEPTAIPEKPSYNRLSAIRRPPRLDMDAVEKAAARGSLTSLPDLIRRATRLAAMIDHGKRPASHYYDANYPDEKVGGCSDRYSSASCQPLIA
jgi:hypothetical protein